MTSSVYLLIHRFKPILKVGKSSNVRNRVRSLGVRVFDMERSRELHVESEDVAARLERAIHKRLASWRLSAAGYSEMVGRAARPSDGATEWFRDDCIPDLVAFLEREQSEFTYEVYSIDVSPQQRLQGLNVGLTIKVSHDLYRRIRRMAIQADSTNTGIGAEALEAYLEANGY